MESMIRTTRNYPQQNTTKSSKFIAEHQEEAKTENSLFQRQEETETGVQEEVKYNYAEHKFHQSRKNKQIDNCQTKNNDDSEITTSIGKTGKAPASKQPQKKIAGISATKVAKQNVDDAICTIVESYTKNNMERKSINCSRQPNETEQEVLEEFETLCHQKKIKFSGLANGTLQKITLMDGTKSTICAHLSPRSSKNGNNKIKNCKTPMSNKVLKVYLDYDKDTGTSTGVRGYYLVNVAINNTQVELRFIGVRKDH